MRTLPIVLTLLTAAFLFGACGGDTQKFDENVTVNPSDPRGSVGGVVFDAHTDAPVEAIQVSLIVGDHFVTTTTDASGVYAFSDVPASGNALLLFSAEGYLSARQSVVFSEAEGNTPYLNPTATAQPLWLVRTGHTFQLRVLDSMGRPVQGHELILSMAPSWFILEGTEFLGSGQFTTTAGTNAMGIATFSGLPLPGQLGSDQFGTAEITIPALDLDGDGYAENHALSISVDTRLEGETIRTVTLGNTSLSPLMAMDSNNPYFIGNSAYPGSHDPGDTIFVNFNQPPSPEDLRITLYDAGGQERGTLQHTLNGSNLLFTIPDTVTPGEKYFVHIFAHTMDNGSVFQRSAPLFITLEDPVTITGIEKVDPGSNISPVRVHFSHYIGTGRSSYTTLVGTDGVVFMNWNYGGAPVVGDAPGENGYNTTQISFRIEEETANAPAYSLGLLGFSKTWVFSGYDTPSLPNTLTEVFFVFDNPTGSKYRMTTPGGVLVPNLHSSLP